MKLTARKISRAVLLPLVFLLVFTLHSQARADTYLLFSLGPDQGGYGAVQGIDDAGDVYIAQEFCVGGQSCWDVYDPQLILQGSADRPSYTLPLSTPIDTDNGTPCSPAPFAAYGRCNNGYEAYLESLTVGTAIFTGPDDTDPLPIAPQADYAQIILINSFGDIAFTNTRLEENYEAYDLTSRQTPEPNTFVFMATGILGLAGAVRRRLR